MKSHLLHTIRLAIGEIGLLSLSLLLAAGVAFIPAQAQDGAWKIDGEHSIARLSSGSTDLGVARVSGDVVFVANEADDPAVNLTIKPDKGRAADYSEVSFKSKRSALTGDGKLAVVGDLSVTHVERSVSLDPNEGYYGATYGVPVVHTDAREVTLLFPAEVHPAVEHGRMQLTASTNISREYFPQLLTALAPGNWPNLVVEDEQCTVPSTIGEGYSGATCTGTPVATASNNAAPATPAVGEGYYGFESASTPNLSVATIALELKLTSVASAPSTASGAAGSAGN